MQAKEVIRQMGRFPDAINPPKRLMSKIWICSQCGHKAESTKPMKVPTKCECGSIFWEAGFRDNAR